MQPTHTAPNLQAEKEPPYFNCIWLELGSGLIPGGGGEFIFRVNKKKEAKKRKKTRAKTRLSSGFALPVLRRLSTFKSNSWILEPKT